MNSVRSRGRETFWCLEDSSGVIGSIFAHLGPAITVVSVNLNTISDGNGSPRMSTWWCLALRNRVQKEFGVNFEREVKVVGLGYVLMMSSRQGRKRVWFCVSFMVSEGEEIVLVYGEPASRLVSESNRVLMVSLSLWH